MDDMETMITGKTVEEALLDSNVNASELLDASLKLSSKSNENNGNQGVGDNYEQLKRAEVKTNWLRHEGTSLFINQLEEVRQEKITKAEHAAKNGRNDEALRLILQSASIRETIEIIGE